MIVSVIQNIFLFIESQNFLFGLLDSAAMNKDSFLVRKNDSKQNILLFVFGFRWNSSSRILRSVFVTLRQEFPLRFWSNSENFDRKLNMKVFNELERKFHRITEKRHLSRSISIVYWINLTCFTFPRSKIPFYFSYIRTFRVSVVSPMLEVIRHEIPILIQPMEKAKITTEIIFLRVSIVFVIRNRRIEQILFKTRTVSSTSKVFHLRDGIVIEFSISCVFTATFQELIVFSVSVKENVSVCLFSFQGEISEIKTRRCYDSNESLR